MTTYDDAPDNSGLIPYRVRQLESFRRETEKWKDDVDDDRRDLKYLRNEMKTLTEAVEDLKKILVRTSITIAGSAALVVISLLSSGRVHP